MGTYLLRSSKAMSTPAPRSTLYPSRLLCRRRTRIALLVNRSAISHNRAKSEETQSCVRAGCHLPGAAPAPGRRHAVSHSQAGTPTQNGHPLPTPCTPTRSPPRAGKQPRRPPCPTKRGPTPRGAQSTAGWRASARARGRAGGSRRGGEGREGRGGRGCGGRRRRRSRRTKACIDIREAREVS